MSSPDIDSSSVPDEEAFMGFCESGGPKKSKNPIYHRVQSSLSGSSGGESHKSHSASAGTGRVVSASMHILAILILVATPFVFYVLYTKLENLSSRVTVLETSTASSAEPAKLQQQEDAEKLQALLDALPKDALAHMLDKDHIVKEHYGIGSQHIAHIYGTKTELESCFNRDDCNEKEFRSLDSNYICTNGAATEDAKNSSTLKARYNENRDVWCVFGLDENMTVGRTDQFLISGKATGHVNPGAFRYFKPASWLAKENFATPQNYAIRVLTDGMYMVFATVHFLSDDASMTVVKEDTNEDLSTIGTCRVNVDVRVDDKRISEETEISCSVSQIATLKAFDKLHMRFTTEKMFWVQEDLLYMTVIKLNSYGVQ